MSKKEKLILIVGIAVILICTVFVLFMLDRSSVIRIFPRPAPKQEKVIPVSYTHLAQQEFATFTQEQVDKIFQAAAIAANQMRIPLAKMAVEETGMGVVEDKVIKNNYAAEYIYNAYKNTKTCDIIEEDKAFGTMKVAEPIGVVAAVKMCIRDRCLPLQCGEVI